VLKEVEAPQPSPNEAVVKVAAISLNRGEVRGALAGTNPGARPGWDIAGTVVTGATDGSGPKAGERVVGLLRTRAWAEQVAVPTTQLAVLPEVVTFEQASTLPVAGLTALWGLEFAGSLLAQKVLVTGASGGVGHLAVQLGVAMGATVVGTVRQERHAAAAKAAGATEIVVDDTGAGASAFGPYRHVFDGVGGQTLVNALKMVAPRGFYVQYGTTAGAATAEPAGLASGATFYRFSVFQETKETAASGLARLAQLVANGRLKPLIDIEAPWTEIGAVAQKLVDRAYPGKAVLHVG
jgi:NADPH:quinone reductase-like Zn-dependent oxidoreductase